MDQTLTVGDVTFALERLFFQFLNGAGLLRLPLGEMPYFMLIALAAAYRASYAGRHSQ